MAVDTGEGYGVIATDPSSGITLSTLKTTCRYLGWTDARGTSTAALVKFINDVVLALAAIAPWPEYLKRDGSQGISSGDDDYTLSETGIDRLGILLRADNTLPLDEISVEEWLRKKKNLDYSGTPTMYALDKTLSGGVIIVKLLLFPEPTATETLYYSYYRKPVEMDSDSDVVDWPRSRIWLLNNAFEYIFTGDNIRSIYSLHDPPFMAKVHSALGDAKASYLPIKTKTIMDTSKMRIRDTYWNVTD